MMINTRSALHIFKKHTLETYKHEKSRTNTSVNCMEKSKTSDRRSINPGVQIHMQTIPAAPLLTPLSVQSSPTSSFFLDRTIESAEEQSHTTYMLEDVPSLPRLDDGDDEVNDVSISEERPLEKSHWSDDSDIDEDEGIEYQKDDMDRFRESVTPAIDFGVQDKETDEQAFAVEGKEDMKAAVVLEETDDETVELNGNLHTGNGRRLNRVSRKSVHASSNSR